MKRLDDKFKKNGLNYKTLERTNDKGLFELSNDDQVVGYEVSMIYVREGQYHDQPTEQLTNNSRFGSDSSKSFGYYKRAKQYYDELP